MPRKLELTWNAKQRRWFKKYHGKQYAFPGSTKAESYESALALWQAKKAEIDAADDLEEKPDRSLERDYRRIIRRWEKASKQCVRMDAPHDLRICSAVLSDLRFKLESGRSLPPIAELDIDYWEDDHPAALARYTNPNGEAPAPDKTIGGNAESFLRMKRQQAEQGHISKGRYGVILAHLNDLAEWLGRDRAIAEVTGQTLADYHARVCSAGLSGHTARDRMQVAKQFLTWAFEIGSLEVMPRNLASKSKSLAVKTTAKRVEVLPPDYVAALLDGTDGRTKLFYLLMLNCGMYAVDISDLRQNEVNWKAGRIVRKRSKTKDHDDVPTVDYRLWPETFALLKECREDKGELVFLNENGSPLRQEKIDAKGVVKVSNNIKSAHFRACKRLQLPCKPIKGFRKTAASKLGEHPTYGRFAQYFLGHSPQSVADKSYIKPSDELFDEALAWLRTHFIAEPKPEPKPKGRTLVRSTKR